jgi:hypothetical protein
MGGKHFSNRMIVFTGIVFVLTALAVQTLTMAGSPYNGFNFYGTDAGTSCKLVDMNGKVIHTWNSSYPLMDKAYLLRDSSVLWPCVDNGDNGNGVFDAGTGIFIVEQGGRFQIIKWDGTVAWDYSYHSTTYMPHHDCYPYYYTNDPKEKPSIFAVVATKESDGTIAEKVVEIKPTGDTTAQIKWEWHAWDHMTDNGKDKPELLDINKGGGGMGSFFPIGPGPVDTTVKTSSGGKGTEWLHANYVRYNPGLDQVLVNFKYLNEFVIVDHGTTIAQATAHTGGKYGKGGDILYRWGCPSNYGDSGTQYLNGQHSACWIPNYMPGTRKPLPGAGHIIVISNSSVPAVGYEVAIPQTNGVYSRQAGQAYGPSAPTKIFNISQVAANEGTLERLPNGNTFFFRGLSMGTGSSVACFEYDTSWTSVWSLKGITAYQCFRYDSAYMGSTTLDTGKVGVIYSPMPPANGSHSRLACRIENGKLRVSFRNSSRQEAKIDFCTSTGRTIFEKRVQGNEYLLDMRKKTKGVYFITVASDNDIFSEKIVIY